MQIPTPQFLNNLQPYVQEYLSNKARFKVLMWHRGARKSTAFINKLLIEAHMQVGLYWYLAPYLVQAVSTVWKDPSTSFFRWIPDDYLKQLRINNSDYSITLPNGSVIQLKGADHMNALRGPKPKGIAVDEYGEIAKRFGSELREAVLEPSVYSSGGWIDYGGTPKGNNDFSHLASLKDPDWFTSLKTVDDTNIYIPEQMEAIHKNITNEDFYFQEYYCRILEGASSVFKGQYDIIKGFLEDPEYGKSYVFGIDLARTFDRTAIVGFDIHTNHLVYFKLITNTSWEGQKQEIVSTLTKYNNAVAVVDATGVGDSFVEQLIRTGSTIVPFKITSNLVKRDLIERTVMFISNKYISIPNIPEILDELNSFEYQVTSSNNVTYNAANGKHDDIVIAIALAIQRLQPTPQPLIISRYNDNELIRMETDPRTGYPRV